MAVSSVNNLLHLSMAKQQREVLRVLVANYPSSVPLEHLINQVWGLDPNGGPEHPENILRVLQNRVNAVIKRYGFRIVCKAYGTRALERYQQPVFSPLSTKSLRIHPSVSVSA